MRYYVVYYDKSFHTVGLSRMFDSFDFADAVFCEGMSSIQNKGFGTVLADRGGISFVRFYGIALYKTEAHDENTDTICDDIMIMQYDWRENKLIYR